MSTLPESHHVPFGKRVSFFNRCRALFYRTDGSALIEKSLLLAGVVAITVVAVQFTSIGSVQTYHEVASAFGSAEAGTAGQQRGQQSYTPVDASGRAPSALASWLAYIMGGAALFAMVGLGYLMYARRRDQTSADELPWSAQLEDPRDLILDKRQQIYRILSNNMQALVESRMQVRHVMTNSVISVGPETSVETVVSTLTDKHLRHVLVCDRKGSLLGIISNRDLTSAHGRSAADIMTENPCTVQHDDLVGPAITMLVKRRISCLPVIKDGKLCGVLTTTDLLMTLQCVIQVLHAIASEISPARQLSGWDFVDEPESELAATAN